MQFCITAIMEGNLPILLEDLPCTTSSKWKGKIAFAYSVGLNRPCLVPTNRVT
jgi:hypothetical protein